MPVERTRCPRLKSVLQALRNLRYLVNLFQEKTDNNLHSTFNIVLT